MTTIEQLRSQLQGKVLPGGVLNIEGYESRIADHALRAPDRDHTNAHPLWFVIASLRGMGISVDELCELAAKSASDTLMLGSIAVEHLAPLRVERTYRTTAQIEAVDRRTARDGSTIDTVSVRVCIADEHDHPSGSVTSNYLFKRAAS